MGCGLTVSTPLVVRHKFPTQTLANGSNHTADWTVDAANKRSKENSVFIFLFIQIAILKQKYDS